MYSATRRIDCEREILREREPERERERERARERESESERLRERLRESVGFRVGVGVGVCLVLAQLVFVALEYQAVWRPPQPLCIGSEAGSYLRLIDLFKAYRKLVFKAHRQVSHVLRHSPHRLVLAELVGVAFEDQPVWRPPQPLRSGFQAYMVYIRQGIYSIYTVYIVYMYI